MKKVKVKVDVNKIKDYKELYEENIEHLNAKIDALENKYKYMFNNKDIKCLMDKIDDLKKELDGVYKVLEITDEQIEGLIKYNNKMEGK